jgi:hypothetical protein
MFVSLCILSSVTRIEWTLLNYKHSVPTLQGIQSVSFRKTSWFMLDREVIAVCLMNHIEHINTLCERIVDFSVLRLAARTVIPEL